MDGARFYNEINAIVGSNRAKSLSNVPKLDAHSRTCAREEATQEEGSGTSRLLVA
jgi:hypothetical protein